MLEAQDAESVENAASSSQGSVAALRDQILFGDEAKSSSRWLDRWKAYLGFQNRTVTLAIVSVLLLSSLMFGLGTTLKISQAEGSRSSISGVIRGLLAPRGPADPAAGRNTAPAHGNTLASYGAGFSWTDRFNRVEVQRETASSKVLWPLSTIISMLIVAALLLPRSNRMPQKSSAD